MGGEVAFKRNSIVNPFCTASNGQEALEMLRSNIVRNDRQFILLDLNMPRMVGIEFLKGLARRPGTARHLGS